jgi:hypothetical protein
MAKITRNTRIFIVLGLLMIMLLLVSFFYLPRTAYPPYSTYSPKPDGAKAILLLLNQEGIEASRLFDPAPSGRGLMIILEPEDNLIQQDWQQALAWVDQGNTLLIAGGNPNFLYQELGYGLIDAPGGIKTHQISSANPLLKDVRELTFPGGTRLTEHQTMTFAYGDEHGIYLAEVVQGKGRLILLTLPDLLTNREIALADNLILFLNIVTIYGQKDEVIWFNEFAHGYTWQKTTREVFTWPLRLVVMQLALGVLLLYYYWGKRFGRIIPLPENLSLVSGDYVSSLANIYRQGRARHLIMGSIYQDFKYDLAQYLGVSKHLSNQELVNFFSQRPRIDSEKLEELLGRWAELVKKPGISETDLFKIVREMEIWRINNLIPRLK